MRKIINKNIIIFLLLIVFIILNTGNSKAVLQANGNEGAVQNISDWMLNIRKMEELGGAMGLSESIGEDLTYSGTSNNIDVHMQKNTEYGALAILSASSYGNHKHIKDGDTTTGNVTGAVMKLNNEWALYGMMLWNSTYVNAKNRYKNLVSMHKPYEPIKGDALTETKGWHNSTISIWLSNDGPHSGDNVLCLVRSVSSYKYNNNGSSSSSIFSYYGYSNEWGGRRNGES